jgi:hypothetical protein
MGKETVWRVKIFVFWVTVEPFVDLMNMLVMHARQLSAVQRKRNIHVWDHSPWASHRVCSRGVVGLADTLRLFWISNMP